MQIRGLQCIELFEQSGPLFVVGLGRDRSREVVVEGKDIASKLWGSVGVVVRQLVEQLGVSRIGQLVLPGLGKFSGIKILIRQLKPVRLQSGKQLAIPVKPRVEARHEDLFGGRRQSLKCQRLERADAGHDPEEKGQDLRAAARSRISRTPVLLIAGTGYVVEEFRAGGAGSILPD